jgi:hypothetical protein
MSDNNQSEEQVMESEEFCAEEQELTDEQLLQMAEGGCTWGTGSCG